MRVFFNLLYLISRSRSIVHFHFYLLSIRTDYLAVTKQLVPNCIADEKHISDARSVALTDDQLYDK